MRILAKTIGYFVLVVFVLLVLILAALRFSPQWVVSAVSSVQSAAQIKTSSLNLQYLPPTLSADSVSVAMAAQDIELQSIQAKLNGSAWWSDTPFWQINIAKVDVTQHPTEAASDAVVASEADAAPGSAGALNVLPYLTFQQVRVDELTVSGDSPVAAKLLAEQDGRNIQLSSSGEIAGTPFSLTGSMERGTTDLGLNLKLESLPTGATDPKVQVALVGLLKSARQLQLAVDSGSAQVELEGQTYRVDSLQGELALVPDKSGDELVFDKLGGSYSHPGWQETLAFQVTGEVSQKASGLVANADLVLGQSELKLTTTPGKGDWHGKVELLSNGLPADLSLAPYQQSDVFPLKLSSQVQVNDTQLVLTGLALGTPQNHLAGDVTLDTGDALQVVAKLQSDKLYFPFVASGDETEAKDTQTLDTKKDDAKAADAKAPDAKTVDAKTNTDEAATDPAVAELPSDAATTDDPADEKVFSDEPIDWEWIEAAEIDVVVQAKKLRLQEAEFTQLDLQLKNNAGQLQLEPLSAKLGGGGFNGAMTLALEPSAVLKEPSAVFKEPSAVLKEPSAVLKEPSAVLKEPSAVRKEPSAVRKEPSAGGSRPVKVQTTFTVDGIALESFGFVPQEELRGGALSVDLDLSTAGLSSHDLASNLGGKIVVMVQEATLMNDFIELAGSDLLMETLNKLNPFAKQDPTTELSCGLIRFTAEEGILTTKNQLVMETSKMEIVGNGSVDLADEKINLTFAPNAKSGVGINVGSLVKFLKLGGTLASPSPAADAGGLLKSGLAIGAAISTGGASVVAEGLAKRVLNSGNACAAVQDGSVKDNDAGTDKS